MRERVSEELVLSSVDENKRNNTTLLLCAGTKREIAHYQVIVEKGEDQVEYLMRDRSEWIPEEDEDKRTDEDIAREKHIRYEAEHNVKLRLEAERLSTQKQQREAEEEAARVAAEERKIRMARLGGRVRLYERDLLRAVKREVRANLIALIGVEVRASIPPSNARPCGGGLGAISGVDETHGVGIVDCIESEDESVRQAAISAPRGRLDRFEQISSTAGQRGGSPSRGTTL